jgi:hypothetical protein
VTDEEIDALIAAWHDGPEDGISLHQYLGLTWDEYKTWVYQGLGAVHWPRPLDTNRSMVPMSGNALRRSCGGCGHEIEPFEPYWRGRLTRVLWCDSCELADQEDE